MPRVLVSNQWTLASLHRYLQWVMGWTDSHAHEFQIGASVVAPDWWIEVAAPTPETGDKTSAREYNDRHGALLFDFPELLRTTD